jgi:hypothetical protein
VAEAREIVHIGLKYNPATQSFRWISGEEVTYTNWAVNQPGFELLPVIGRKSFINTVSHFQPNLIFAGSDWQ